MKEVTSYITKKEKWKTELELLRETLLSTNLEETIKWGAPTYVYEGKNIVGMAAFKNYCGLWFFQGGTLKDEKKVLMNAQEGKTQAMRQWRFYTLKEIDAALIKKYVAEAVKNQKEGNIIKPKRKSEPLKIPLLLKKAIEDNNALNNSFQKFTVSKQREFANYIIEAKRDATKQKRLEKIIPMILNGVGLHDKYKNC